MGRKELVLINLAPASSPCLLTGLLALVLPSRCAPSLQVELVLHFVLVVRRGGGRVLLDLPAGDGSRANEKRESQAIPQAKTGRPCCVSSCHLRCLACFLLLFLVFPLGAFSSYTRARSRCSSAGTSRSVGSRDERKDGASAESSRRGQQQGTGRRAPKRRGESS